MKFMFMIYHDENVLDAMPETEMQPLVDSAIEYAEEIRRSGHYVASDALQRTRTARTVRIRAGLVQVPGLDDAGTTQLILCPGKGAGGSGGRSGAGPDGAGRPGPLESVRGDVVAAPSDLLGVLDRGVDKRLHLRLGHRVQHVLVVVDHEHELHRILLTGEAP